MRRDGMQTIGLQARRAHQAGADEQLQHSVAHKGQRQRRHFVNVDFGFLCKQHIFYYLVQIIEFVLADLDRVLFLNALGDQLVQNAGITQLRLEILQALVVLDVRTGEDTLQPRGIDGELVVAGALHRERTGRLGVLVGALVLGS